MPFFPVVIMNNSVPNVHLVSENSLLLNIQRSGMKVFFFVRLDELARSFFDFLRRLLYVM